MQAVKQKKCMTDNKGFVCVDDKTVFGWAMHYFEEDSIEGTLYNEDGTEYKPIKETKTVKEKKVEQPKIEQPKPKKEDKQLTLFNMFSENISDKEIEEEHEEIVQENIQENVQENSVEIEEIPKINPEFERYISLREKYNNAIILIKSGDFYESFSDNAELLSDELYLTLVNKDVGLENKVSMVGFPIHKLSDNLEKLCDKYDVLLVDDKIETFLECENSKNKCENNSNLLPDFITIKNSEKLTKMFAIFDGKLEVL